MARLFAAALLLTLGLSVAAWPDDAWQYLTGVYWFDGEFYQTDVTCWNIPGNPQGGLVNMIKMHPGALAADAPEGWGGWAEEGWPHIWWYTNLKEYMIPPGDWLSGFTFTTDYDPGEVVYHYGIKANHGGGTYGEFTPEYIPEPWFAGPLACAVLAAWHMLRRRR